MSKLYHVTFTRNVGRILKDGILTFRTTNWVQAGNRERYGDGSIYAFENEQDAMRWAGRMDWDHHQAVGSGKVSIVEFAHDDGDWSEDNADPLSRAGQSGRWLKSRKSVKPQHITGSRKMDSAMAQALAKQLNGR